MDTLKAIEPFSRSKMSNDRLYSIFDVLKVIDEKERHLIRGYVRELIEYPSELIIVTCIWYYVQIDADLYTIVDTFEEMDLNAALLQGIAEIGITKPSIIQRRALPPLIDAQDTLIETPCGAGTAITHCIAALQRVDINLHQPQILVFAPTEEACASITWTLQSLSKYMVTSVSVRESASEALAAMENYDTQINVAMPDVIETLLENEELLRLDALKMIILHDVNDGRFIDFFDILPAYVQIAVFNELISEKIFDFFNESMSNPVYIWNENNDLTLNGLKEYYVAVELEDYKLATLHDLFEELYDPSAVTQIVIHCNTFRKAMWIKDKMREVDDETLALVIHDAMDQDEMTDILKKLKVGQSYILIVKCVYEFDASALIINYDIPISTDDYFCRVQKGRKEGRAKGVITFVTNNEEQKWRNIENSFNTNINELPWELGGLFD